MRLAVPRDIDPVAIADWRPGAPIVDLRGETMGTTWHVRLAAPGGFDRAALLRAIETRLKDILAEMSHWRSDSVLGGFNRAAAGSWITLPRDFALVLEAALAIGERSAGAFDPAAGALVNLWGFGPEPATGQPDAAAIAAALRRSGGARLAYDPATRRLRQPGGVRLDLSGIAKGFGVDALAALLRDHGCRHALIEIGGELLGLGLRPDGDPWWVDLETPAADIAPMRMALHQLAVATSGDYVRGRHTIDPRNGRPVDHALSISVVHHSAMLADGWATALSVEPPATMRALATREGLAVRALLRDGQDVGEWISPALRTLLVDEEAEVTPDAQGI